MFAYELILHYAQGAMSIKYKKLLTEKSCGGTISPISNFLLV